MDSSFSLTLFGIAYRLDAFYLTLFGIASACVVAMLLIAYESFMTMRLLRKERHRDQRR